jgi:hypothetical protein
MQDEWSWEVFAGYWLGASNRSNKDENDRLKFKLDTHRDEWIYVGAHLADIRQCADGRYQGRPHA